MVSEEPYSAHNPSPFSSRSRLIKQASEISFRWSLRPSLVGAENRHETIVEKDFKEKSTGLSHQEKNSIRRLRKPGRKPGETLSSPLCQYSSCYTCVKARKIGSGVNSTTRNMVVWLRALKGPNIPCYKVTILSHVQFGMNYF